MIADSGVNAYGLPDICLRIPFHVFPEENVNARLVPECVIPGLWEFVERFLPELASGDFEGESSPVDPAAEQCPRNVLVVDE